MSAESAASSVGGFFKGLTQPSKPRIPSRPAPPPPQPRGEREDALPKVTESESARKRKRAAAQIGSTGFTVPIINSPQ